MEGLIKVKCIDNRGTGLLCDQCYFVSQKEWDSPDTNYVDTGGGRFLKGRFTYVVPLEEKDNLWDFLEEELKECPVERHVIKKLIYTFIFGGEVLESCKEFKLSLLQVSTIVIGFDKWTGADDEEVK